MTPTPAPATPKPRSNSRGILIVGAIIVVLYVIGNSSKTSSPASGGGAAPAVTAWWPAGFSATTDPKVAYKWSEKGTYSCELERCWGMEVIARDGCPSSLYVEVAVADSGGAAVGYSNDTAGAVQAGQHAKLVFENTEPTGQTARLTTVSCR